MRKFLVTVNGGSYEVTVEEIGGVAPLAAPAAAPTAAPAPAPAAAPAPAPAAAPAPTPVAGGEKVVAPMPGTILSVSAQNGADVRKGDVLVVLEAMKMENEILAPRDGKVAQVAVSKGTSVNTGDVLVVLA